MNEELYLNNLFINGPPNAQSFSSYYNTNDNPLLYQALGELLSNQIGAGFCIKKGEKSFVDFRNININDLVFQNPLKDFEDRITELHSQVISNVLTGPNGYNGGSGPMSLNRASEILTIMGGNYDYGTFGNPVENNLYSVVLEPYNYPDLEPSSYGPRSIPFYTPQSVPKRMSLLYYGANIFDNITYYILLSKNISHILQSMKGRVSLDIEQVIGGIIGNLFNPCYPLYVLLNPILVGIELILQLLNSLVNLLSNLLNYVMEFISEILRKIFDLIKNALEALVHMLGLNGVSGLLSQLLSLLDDPCIRYIIYNVSLLGYKKGIVNPILLNILRNARNPLFPPIPPI
ncbi:MAG: hypothetical protein NZZ41_00650 [Candidatus Dojkabacteria bacterium]|nr:hypothetical protein [Candidatus Dojkabacteria bacterium]